MSSDNALSRALKSYFTRPFAYAIILTVVASTIGILVGLYAPEKLKSALFTGSIALIFGGLLTAVIKLLVEDHKRVRDSLVEQARFMSHVLSDLEAVYDRVGRARIVISAHKSASTYGTEMRDLIYSRVQLRNVIRALDDNEKLSDVKRAVQAMESYLEELTDVFESIYLGASKSQAKYEADKKRIVDDISKETNELTGLENEAWPQIAEALHNKGFILYAKESPLAPSDYEKNFEEPLNLASWVLRAELKIHAGITKKKMPEEYNELLDRLKKDGE